jgi:hypothetical protein
MRRLLLSLAAASLLVATSAGAALAGGPPLPDAFIVDGVMYRTVLTPTDLSGTGAPHSSYDTIYVLGNGLTNVAEAAPGDPDYNGGRWKVRPLTWHVTPYQLQSAEEVLAASQGMDPDLSLGDTVAQFVCPVIPMPGNH